MIPFGLFATIVGAFALVVAVGYMFPRNERDPFLWSISILQALVAVALIIHGAWVILFGVAVS